MTIDEALFAAAERLTYVAARCEEHEHEDADWYWSKAKQLFQASVSEE